MQLLRVCLGDEPPKDLPVRFVPGQPIPDLYVYLCTALELPREVIEVIRSNEQDAIKVYYLEDGQVPGTEPLPRRCEVLSFSGTFHVKLSQQLQRHLARTREVPPSPAPLLPERWQGVGQTWQPSVTFSTHPLVSAFLRPEQRILTFKATIQSAPSVLTDQQPAAPPELQCRYMVGKRYYQRALHQRLQELFREGPHIGFGLEDPFLREAWNKLSEYMRIGSIVFECVFGRDLVLLLIKDSGSGEFDMSGYIVKASFALDQAKEQLGRQLTSQQMMLVLDIDHTLLQCYHYVEQPRDGDNFSRSKRAHMIPCVPVQANADHVAVPDEQLREMPQDEQIHFWFHDGGLLYAVAVREGIYKIMDLVYEGKYRPLFLTTGQQAYGERVIEALRIHILENPPVVASPAYNRDTVSQTFCPENVCSASSMHYFLEERLAEARHDKEDYEKIARWGPKSYKQQFIFASFPELSSRYIVGVDDKVSSTQHVQRYNYDLDHVGQVLRIPKMEDTRSSRKPMQERSWHGMYVDLCEVHRLVTSGECTVEKAVTMRYDVHR